MSDLSIDTRLSKLSLSSDPQGEKVVNTEIGYPHHERFYFDDGSVTFIVRALHHCDSVSALCLCYFPRDVTSLDIQVEGTAYCLHRY